MARKTKTKTTPASAQERRWQILEEVLKRGSLRFGDARAFFEDCPTTTLGNDFALLTELGLILREAQGVYVPAGKAATGLAFRNGPYAHRLDRNWREKTAMARFIVRNCLDPGMVIAIDSGTSVTAVAKQIPSTIEEATVLTSNFHAAVLLFDSTFVGNVFVLGGRLDRRYAAIIVESLTGAANRPTAADSIGGGSGFAGFGIDVAVVGASGVSSAGISTRDVPQHAFKSWMMSESPRVLIPAYHEKLGAKPGLVFASVSERIHVVTDSNFGHLDDKKRAVIEVAITELRSTGCTVTLVNEEGHPADSASVWP